MSSSDSSVGPSFFSSSLATAGGPNSVDEWISDRSCYRCLELEGISETSWNMESEHEGEERVAWAFLFKINPFPIP